MLIPGIMSDRFENQVAIITGGADGIGKSIASRLASEGAQVRRRRECLDAVSSVR